MKISLNKNIQYVIGIDEVGRGPIAGPVCVGAYLIPRSYYVQFTRLAKKLGITDSKKLTEPKRVALSEVLCDLHRMGKTDFSIAMSSSQYIDTHGIVSGIKKALHKTLTELLEKNNLSPQNVLVLLDGGLRAPEEFIHQKTIIRGDGLVPVISAASIVAKVHRDRYMIAMAKKYPGFRWEQNKGYGTAAHYQGIKKLGMTKLHRRSFL
jgi:ribonuclease HII